MSTPHARARLSFQAKVLIPVVIVMILIVAATRRIITITTGMSTFAWKLRRACARCVDIRQY